MKLPTLMHEYYRGETILITRAITLLALLLITATAVAQEGAVSLTAEGTEPSLRRGDGREVFVYRLTGYDVLALPGQRVRLRTKVECNGPLRMDVHGIKVAFKVAGTLIGSAVSSGDGYADLIWQAPKERGHYLVISEAKQAVGIATVFVRHEDDTFFVTDIDQTISDLDGVLVPFTPNKDIDPLPGSVQALWELAKDHTIIYLTARDDFLMRKTRRWLALRGFPQGPLYTHDWKLIGGDSHGKYKTKILIRLKRSFPYIEAGAGDQRHDAQAYLDNDMRAYLIHKDLPGAQRVEGWRDILHFEGYSLTPSLAEVEGSSFYRNDMAIERKAPWEGPSDWTQPATQF